MKKQFSIISLFLIFFSSIEISGQNVLQNIKKECGFILLRKKININYYFERILDNVDEIEILDKNDLDDFKIQLTKYKFDNQTWNKTELENNFYIVNSGQKLIKDSVDSYSLKNNLTKENKDLLKKSVKDYNANDPEWRNIPISLSDIIYNSKENLAIITINRGNDGGSVDVYIKKDEEWILLGKIYRWSY